MFWLLYFMGSPIKKRPPRTQHCGSYTSEPIRWDRIFIPMWWLIVILAIVAIVKSILAGRLL